VTSGGRLWVAAVAVGVAAAAPSLALAAPSSVAADPIALTPRHTAQGWVDLVQAGASVLGCPEGATACLDRSDPSVPTGWVDVDADPSTVNSSRAVLVLPAGAAVNWAGLYWGGERGAPRCAAAPPAAADQVRLAIGTSAYTAIAASSLTEVAGGAAFQAYADITALLGPAAGSTEPVPLTVANVQVAQGPGCTGGWTVLVAYSYPEGPEDQHPATYRTIAVYDAVVDLAGGTPQELRLDRLATGTADARLTSALLFAGPSVDLGLGGAAVARSGDGVTGVSGVPGSGYHLATSPVPGESVADSSATLTLAAPSGAYVGAVLGLSRLLPVKVDLSVSTSLTPTSLSVGSDATLKVTVRNDSDVRATGVAVALRLPAGLTLTAGVARYDAGRGVWGVGSVPARGSASLVLPLRVLSAGPLTAAAEVSSSHLPDLDSSPGDGQPDQDDLSSVALTVPSPTAPATSAQAQAAVPSPSAMPWSRFAPAALIGIGLVALGLLMLLIVVVRGRTAR
jgi:uncharacterized repeat protein (TIGR01451 family)